MPNSDWRNRAIAFRNRQQAIGNRKFLPGAPDLRGTVKSIAVLPFTIIGAPSNQEQPGLGMADAIIYRLSKLEKPVILPTSTIYKYDNSSRDIFAVGRELGVDAVLDGTVQRAGVKVRATAQLCLNKVLTKVSCFPHYQS